jgi:hypothetical protein
MRSVRRRRLIGVGVLCVIALAAAACKPAPQLGIVARQRAIAPKWPLLADPWVLPAGGKYYVFGSNTFARLPIQQVDSLDTSYDDFGWLGITKEGMPHRAPWALDDTLWAPTVAKIGNYYVLFFAAFRGSRSLQCIGRALSLAPGGPYSPEPTPFSCGLDGHRGALDPAIFQAPNGKVWLYAAFADTERPIYVIPLDGNGNAPRRPDGQANYWPFPVFGKTYAWEGRFIENPSMMYDASTNTYLLAYSAGDWWKPSYVTGLARCSTPVGACSSNPNGPWLVSGSGRTGVGGLSFFPAYPDGSPRAVYASFPSGHEGVGKARAGSIETVRTGNAPALLP